MANKLAVVGVPQLIPLLEGARFQLLTTSTDAAEVAKAVREFDGNVKFIVRASDDSRVKAWTGLMLQQGRSVVLVSAAGDPDMGLEAPLVHLPATMDDITSRLGAPPRPGGTTVIEFAPVNPPAPVPAADDNWGDFSDPQPSATSAASATQWTPVPAPVSQPTPANPQPQQSAQSWDSPSTAWGARPEAQSQQAQQPANPWTQAPPSSADSTGAGAPSSPWTQGSSADSQPAQQPANPWADASATQPPSGAPSNPWTQAPPSSEQQAPQPQHTGGWNTGQQPAVPPQPEPQPQTGWGNPTQPAWNGIQQPQAQPKVDDPFSMTPDVPQQSSAASEMFGLSGNSGGPRMPGEKCPVIISWAGKGGTGKSSCALGLAAEAAAKGLRVVLVDMNRGQGDTRKYLRLSRDQSLFTIYDAALARSPKAAIMSPTMVTAARHDMLPDVKFGMVLAPREGQTDPTVATAEFYRAVIDAARQVADLVIVDTQIVEDHDTSTLIDGVAIPLVKSHGGWAVAVADASLPGVDNTRLHIEKFGVGPERMMFLVNKMTADSPLSQDILQRSMGGKATIMGTVPLDEEVVTLTNRGQFSNDFEPMGRLLSAILLRVTGNAAFQRAEKVEKPAKKRRGLFGRRG